MEEKPSLKKGELTITIPEHGDKKREWPKAANASYDNGRQFGFIVKNTKQSTVWEWPWPKRIGLPTFKTLQEWLYTLDDWKLGRSSYLGSSDCVDDDHIESCVRLITSRI